MDLSNSSLDFIDTLPAPKAVDDAREFAEMVLARLNAGWDFSSPNFGFTAWDNTPASELAQFFVLLVRVH